MGGAKQQAPANNTPAIQSAFGDLQSQLGNQMPTDTAAIQNLIEQQKQQGTQANTGYAQSRQENLNSLANLLATQQKQNLNLAIPDIAQQANINGVYRSSGLGNAIAHEAGNLTASTNNALAQQQLANQGQNLADTQNTENSYLQGLASPLQRQFSLEDYMNQARTAEMGAIGEQPTQPVASGGKTGGQGAAQGALSGASTGATVGGPWGALAGGVIGGAGGYYANK